MDNSPPTPELAPVLKAIARRCFGTDSLETQNSDSKDFRDVAVWNLRAALEDAFAAGQASKEKAPE